MRSLHYSCVVSALWLGACSDGTRASEAGRELDGASGADAAVGDAASSGARPEVVREPGVLPDGGALVLGSVRINELDCEGDRVELFNAGATAQELARFSVADSIDEAVHSQRLSGSLAAGAYQVVTLGEFGIQCGDENTVLFENHEIADLVLPTRAPSGATWGRLPDGSGDFAPTAPTLGAANRPFEDESRVLYAPLETAVEVRITLSASSRAALVAEPRSYAEGSLTLEAAGKKLGPLRVGVRLKGHEGSFEDLDHKPALKLSMDHVVEGQRAFGQKKLTLNNFKQDDAAIREWLAYRIFGAVGVPAARVGYAHVTLDGSDYGTYLLVESLDERDFLSRNFPSTLATYEPAAGQDISPENVPMFEVDKGDETDRSQLLAIASALRAEPPGGVYQALKARIDYPEVLREMAVELFTGEWDGYVLAINNYVIHLDERGVLRLVPWGTDQAFASRESLFRAQGVLLATCLAELACIDAWIDALQDVRAKVRGLLDAGLASEAHQLAALNAGRFASDPRVAWDVAGVEARARAVVAELPERLAGLVSDLDCLAASPDEDADGRRCALDCDDADGTRYHAAEEVCGDQIDQDCNGTWDDGPSCPACAPDSALPGYLFCPHAALRSAAESECVAAGGHLASISSQSENDAIATRAGLWFSDSPIWIGLRAPASSSGFAWSDGSALAYDAYAPGEPAGDGSEERCVSLRPADARWTTDNCYGSLPYVCER